MNNQIQEKTIKIKLDNKEIELKKLPLKKYYSIFNILDVIPKKFAELTIKDNSEILSNIPKLIAESFDEIVSILTIATDLKNEEIEQFSLDEIVKILNGIIEVNKYEEVFNDLKKMFASNQ